MPALATTLLAAAMLPVLGLGLWRSGMLAQPLWSPTLAAQALLVLALSALGTAAATRLRSPWRGWPALAALALLATAALAGPAATLAALLLTLCCLVIGQALCLALAREPAEPALAAAAGLAAIILILVGTTAARIPARPVCLLIPAACLATLAAVRPLRAVLAPRLPRPTAWPPARTLAAALILAALVFAAANAALPERFYDPLTMHLMIPTQTLDAGRWTPDGARFALAWFPLGVDHLFTLAAALAGGMGPVGEAAIHLVNLFAAAGTALLLHALVRDLAGPRLAEWTVLLFLAMPLTLLLATTGMVEMPLTFLITAAARAALLARRPHGLATLAVLLPALAAIKLHGAVAAIPLAAVAVALRGQALRDRGLRAQLTPALLAVAAVAAALGATQYANAWLHTGNPVFPLLNDLFRSPLWPPTRFEDVRWQGHLSWRLLYRMTFDSRTYLESDNGALGVALLLLLLPGLAATLLKPRAAPLAALAVAAVYAAAILPSIQYIRYLYPVVPLLLVLCAHGLAQLRPALAAIPVALSVAGGALLLPSAGWVLKTADLRAAIDPGARRAMLATQGATRLAVDAASAIGGPKPRVLFGGEPYGAFLRGTYIYAAWYDHTLNAALYAAATPAEVDAALAPQRADFAIAAPASPDPTERKVAAWAEAHGTRIPLPGATALWRITAP